MKNKIILSIKPEYVKPIINGTKKFEYRTRVPKQTISSIIIYETYPFKRIVAEAEVIEILKDNPTDLWNMTKEYSGTSEEFFFEYFKDREIAYAYRLGNVKVYDNPLSLEDFGIKAAPQSFVYVN